jgi:hypothetical protein
MDDEQLAKIGIKRSGIRDHAEHLVTYEYGGLHEHVICNGECQSACIVRLVVVGYRLGAFNVGISAAIDPAFQTIRTISAFGLMPEAFFGRDRPE